MSNVFICPVCGDKYESIIDFSEHVNCHAETEKHETRKKAIVDDAMADFSNIIHFADEFEKLIEDFNTKFAPNNIVLTTKYCHDTEKPDSINLVLSDERKVYNAYNFSFGEKNNSYSKAEMKNISTDKSAEQTFLNEFGDKLGKWSNKNSAPEKKEKIKARTPSLADFMETYGDLIDKSKGIESFEPLLKKYAKDCNINVESEEEYGEFLDSLLTTGIATILGDIFM